MNLVSLDGKRDEQKAKGPRCQACGAPVHDYPGQCWRIASIEQTEDSIIYHLWPIDGPDDTEPDDAA